MLGQFNLLSKQVGRDDKYPGTYIKTITTARGLELTTELSAENYAK